MAKQFIKKQKVAHMPAPSSSEEGAIATEAPPETPFDPPKPEKGKAGRPPRNQPGAPPPKSVTFWQRIEQIAFEDWGTRAKMRLYRLAPLIDRLRGSECKYIRSYEETINEDRIKQDEGSGRYRLYLGFKTAGGGQEKELDSIDFDILDQRFPPNIPAGEWMNDPRNNTWAWAKPANVPGPHYQTTNGQPAAAPPNPLDAVVQGMKLASDMRKDLRDEMQPAATQQSNGAAAAPAPVDPWLAAERILNMRSNNPMVEVLEKQLTELRASMEKRDERMAKLQEDLFAAKIESLKASLQPQQQQGQGLLEQAQALAKVLGVEPADMLKRFMGVDGSPVKSKMSGWMEFVGEILPTALNSPILTAIASKLTAAPGQPAGPMAAQPQPQNGTAASPQQELFAFVNTTVTPALIEYISTGNSGTNFAEWMFNGYPEKFAQLQNIEYHLLPGLKGAPVILELYKHSPSWQLLAPFESKLPKFIEEFCNWKEEEDPNEPPTIDLKAEQSSDPDNAGGDF